MGEPRNDSTDFSIQGLYALFAAHFSLTRVFFFLRPFLPSCVFYVAATWEIVCFNRVTGAVRSYGWAVTYGGTNVKLENVL